MKPAAIPNNDQARVDTLRSLNVLDTPAEERFDRITRLAKRLFGVPMSLVTLIDEDRQWIKSAVGLDRGETTRDVAFCAHTILGDEVLTVPDATLDERFHDNPFVTGDPNIRFYAGYPLTVGSGMRLGSLCLCDTKPRTFDEEDHALLRDLAKMVEHELIAIQLSNMDELTSLSNRRGFEDLSQHALSLCKRLSKPACMLFLDLNRFKQINDEYGHAEGDQALISFSNILVEVFRDSDVVGRLGGDEFVVFLTNTTRAQCDLILDRLAQAVSGYNMLAGKGYDLAFSVGAIEYDKEKHVSISDLLDAADKLMYQHKNENR